MDRVLTEPTTLTELERIPREKIVLAYKGEKTFGK